jgi:hypothetical protein
VRCDVKRLDLSICRDATIYLYIPVFVRKDFVTQLRDISDLGPAEMDLLRPFLVYKLCGFTALSFVYKFSSCTALPSAYKCAVLPLYIPYTRAQFTAVYSVHVRSFTAVYSVHMCAVLPLCIPYTRAQFYRCIFRSHVHSFTVVSSVYICVVLLRH